MEHSTHFNPVVSFVMRLRGEISTPTPVKFSVLQIGGAILGVILANYIFSIEPIQFSEKSRSGTHLFCQRDTGYLRTGIDHPALL